MEHCVAQGNQTHSQTLFQSTLVYEQTYARFANNQNTKQSLASQTGYIKWYLHAQQQQHHLHALLLTRYMVIHKPKDQVCMLQAMQVQNHVWGPAIMTFLTAAANIPINMILIKYYGFWGAALATSVARILLLVLLCGEQQNACHTIHATQCMPHNACLRMRVCTQAFSRLNIYNIASTQGKSDTDTVLQARQIA